MQRLKTPFRLGLLVGLVFGCMNIVLTWLRPLDDDSPGVLLRFYGPMFVVWAIAAFMTVRRGAGVKSGVATGAVIAFATFCVYDLLVLLRVNLFLHELTDRGDWQQMMMRFDQSGLGSLRLFINLDYLKGAPFKIAVASTIGALMGLIGGTLGRIVQTDDLHAARR